jgi:uncharacterized protein (DUF1499 family)
MALAPSSLFAATPSTALGLADGMLAPCPDRPNCVSSRATVAAQAIAPLAYEGSAESAWRRLGEWVRAANGARVVADQPVDGTPYLRAEFRSALFGFVDDVEFALDAKAAVIHVRSAARTGHWDLGVNRARVERLRPAVTQGGSR